MSIVDVDTVLANIKACRLALKWLENYRRPVAPKNDELKWGEFVEVMGESVRYFDAFNRPTRVDMENLKRAKMSLEAADTKLKTWAGGSAVLYNVERGDLAHDLLHCKRLIAWLEKHLGGGSAASEASAVVVGQHVVPDPSKPNATVQHITDEINFILTELNVARTVQAGNHAFDYDMEPEAEARRRLFGRGERMGGLLAELKRVSEEA